MNLNQNPRTLLPKFFGLYCYQCNSKNVRLIAMNNLLPSSIKLHMKYDLKGSTYKRKVSFFANISIINPEKLHFKLFFRLINLKDRKILLHIKIWILWSIIRKVYS